MEVILKGNIRGLLCTDLDVVGIVRSVGAGNTPRDYFKKSRLFKNSII
jgi:hypothetical protein